MTRFQTGHGVLTIKAKGDTPRQCSPLTIMARDTSYQVQVVATPQSSSGAAMGLFYNTDNWVFVELKNGQLSVSERTQTLASRVWQTGMVHLKIVNDRNRVEFLASENGNDWQSLVADFDMSGFNHSAMHGFQCLRPALAATGSAESRFTDFTYVAL